MFRREVQMAEPTNTIADSDLATTEYLYGCKPESFQFMPYKTALNYKQQMASKLIKELLMPDYMVRDVHRLQQVQKAVSHTASLLTELK